MYNLEGLVSVYNSQNNTVKSNEYTDKILKYLKKHEAWLNQVNTASNENCICDNLRVDKFKCILNGCNCEKQ